MGWTEKILTIMVRNSPFFGLNMVVWAVAQKSYKGVNLEIVFQNDHLDNKKLEKYQVSRERKYGRLTD